MQRRFRSTTMRLTSLSTKILILLSTLVAFAFDGDDDTFYFSLSSNKIYAPGDPETAVEFGGNGVGSTVVKFRAFRVSDPVAFFLQQKDPHSPTLTSLTPPNTFDMIERGFDKVKRDARFAARDVMPAQARRTLRDVADLNGVKAEKRAPKETKREREARIARGIPTSDDIPNGAEKFEVVAQWDYKVGNAKEQWNYGSVKVPITKKGVYLIEARARGKRAITALVISELGMVIKQADDRALAFVVDRKTGEKVADVPLTFARGGAKITTDETNSDGALNVTIPKPPEPKAPAEGEDVDEMRWDYRRFQLLVLGEKDGNFVISDPYYYGGGDERKIQVYLHTDRPVYRPDQSVYYRGIARRVTEDGTYENLTNEKVYVEVTDARDGSILKDTLKLSDMGTFNGELKLAEEPPLGTYSIKVRIGETDNWFNFSVEEYKKPEYKVEVALDRDQYTRGDLINATVKADYFFGSPVANAQVEYFVFRAQYWRPWWRGSDWAYLYDEGGDFQTYRMEMVHSGEGTLQPDGTFNITYQTDPKADQDYVYRIQANVVDNSRRSISGAKSVEVTRGEFYISARTDKYVYKPGDEAKISVEIATFDGDRPVATPFNIRVVRTWWDKPTGRDSEYKRNTKTIWSGSGATQSDGKGSVTYKPTEAGYFEMQIEAKDSRRTKITESSYIYVADAAYADWYREGSGDVQIIPDKESYSPGETMSALVIMPASKIDALITTEGATLYSHQVERLASNSAIVRVPIEDRFAPVFYVNATTIVNDQLYSESKRITVVPKGKLIRLEVKTDKEQYRPGDKGTLTIRALDERGEPVSNTDVAVAMVDEAVYSIMPDATPDIQRFFFGNRWNEVATSSSLQFSFYADARRMADGDALFGAAEEGAAGGRGLFSPAAPMMAKNGARDDAGQRALAFGDVKGEMFVEPAMRKDFKDMMFWTPSARTGSDGYAKLEVKFPDNLTTWRITARGVTKQTAVGQSVTRVVARKELLVRMETPRFLIQGDELLIATTVHNYLDKGKVTKVQFSGDNVLLADKEQTVEIPAGGEKRIDWKLTAPKTGTATISVKALTNEESDAMEMKVPVLPKGLKVATGQSTDIEDPSATRTLSFTIPDNSDPSTGQIYINVAPSLAGSILGALDELVGYPYGCVEQTMSRFLPTLVVADVLNKLDVPFDDKKRAEIPKMVASGLSRLYGMQHSDGGWGWWVNDETDAFMTAYVVYGMTIAKKSGFNVIDDRYNNGVAKLRSLVESGSSPDNRPMEATTRAYMIYALSLAGDGSNDKMIHDKIAALTRRDTLNNYGRALLTLASSANGDKQLAGSLAVKLESGATVNGANAFWSGKQWHYNWEDDQVETSAAVVRALLEQRGETELVKKGVRWLLSQKEGDAWHNTRQTAMVIYSLSDYLKKSRELEPDYTYVVKVNGREVQNGRMTRADVFAPEKQIKLERATLQSGVNSVTIEKNGRGRLYSATRLVYYATGGAIQPASAGFKVTREMFELRKEKKGDVYVYTKRPFDGTVKTGDEIFVKVKVTPDARYEYFMLEDPLPAGCEVVQNTDGYTIPGEVEYDEKAREKRGWYGWYWWYADRDVRDEKVAFFATVIMPQQYEFSYVMRAQIPGKYSIMPSVGMLMYYPEVRGNSGQLALNITE